MALSTAPSTVEPRRAKDYDPGEGLFDHDPLALATEGQAGWGDEEPARVRR